MNQTALLTSITLALALPGSLLAQQNPGKASDGVKEPPSKAPGTREPGRPGTAEPGKSGDAVKEPSAAATLQQFKGEITGVDREARTIVIKDEKMGTHKLHISDKTKLTRGEKMASWDDLKVGTNVAGTCRGGKDQAHAETLTVGS